MLFKENSFINGNQSEKGIVYHFNQSEKNIVHQNKSKFRKFSWKCVLGTAVMLNIFSNIKLINKKFSRNIDGHMKEQSWKNEACGFINFEIINEKPPWNVIKDHISATKGSITSKNFEIFFRNLTHSWKHSYWRFVEIFKCVADIK